MLYLDHNATTPPSAAVVEAVRRSMQEAWGNPSSTHALGEAARAQLSTARAAIARLLGARDAREVLCTSGGTEAIQTAILGVWRAQRARGRTTILSTRAEHAATRRALDAAAQEGARVVWLPVDAHARVDGASLRAALSHDTALVTLLYANNETGTLLAEEPAAVAALSREVRAAGAVLHLDAVQALGRIPFSVVELDADCVSVSAHKLHGPKGVGALWLRPTTKELWEPLLAGSQEAGRRGGTENLPGIIGFGVAAEEARRWLEADGPRALAAVRAAFEERILERLPWAHIQAAHVARLPNTSSLTLPGVDAELLLALLDAEGVCISAGSACNARQRAPSPVLEAMGLSALEARCTVRVSFGRTQTVADAQAGADRIAAAACELKYELTET